VGKWVEEEKPETPAFKEVKAPKAQQARKALLAPQGRREMALVYADPS
jgi:hypothetical protein